MPQLYMDPFQLEEEERRRREEQERANLPISPLHPAFMPEVDESIGPPPIPRPSYAELYKTPEAERLRSLESTVPQMPNPSWKRRLLAGVLGGVAGAAASSGRMRVDPDQVRQGTRNILGYTDYDDRRANHAALLKAAQESYERREREEMLKTRQTEADAERLMRQNMQEYGMYGRGGRTTAGTRGQDLGQQAKSLYEEYIAMGMSPEEARTRVVDRMSNYGGRRLPQVVRTPQGTNTSVIDPTTKEATSMVTVDKPIIAGEGQRVFLPETQYNLRTPRGQVTFPQPPQKTPLQPIASVPPRAFAPRVPAVPRPGTGTFEQKEELKKTEMVDKADADFANDKRQVEDRVSREISAAATLKFGHLLNKGIRQVGKMFVADDPKYKGQVEAFNRGISDIYARGQRDVASAWRSYRGRIENIRPGSTASWVPPEEWAKADEDVPISAKGVVETPPTTGQGRTITPDIVKSYMNKAAAELLGQPLDAIRKRAAAMAQDDGYQF